MRRGCWNYFRKTLKSGEDPRNWLYSVFQNQGLFQAGEDFSILHHSKFRTNGCFLISTLILMRVKKPSLLGGIYGELWRYCCFLGYSGPILKTVNILCYFWRRKYKDVHWILLWMTSFEPQHEQAFLPSFMVKIYLKSLSYVLTLKEMEKWLGIMA